MLAFGPTGDTEIAHQSFPRHIKLTSEQIQLVLVPLIDRVGVARHISKPGQSFHLERPWAQSLTESVAALVDKLYV